MASSSPRLTVLGGPLAGKELSIEDAVDNVLIGSDPSCRFCLPVPGISPIHARVWVDLQGVTVYDTNAPEGLYVNDDKVVGQASLRNGDILWLGTPGHEDVVMIQCRIPPRASAAAAPPPVVEEEAPTLALPPEPAQETTVLATDAVLAAEAVPPPEPPDETLQIPAEPTFVLTPGDTRPPEPLGEDLPQTVVMHDVEPGETAHVPPPEFSPLEAGTLVMGGEEPPWPAPPAVGPTPAPFPPEAELPPVAPVFEEDIEEAAAATVALPPPPPPAPAPRPEPPRVVTPPPMPRPAPVVKPVARPPAAVKPAAVKPAPVVPAPAPAAAASHPPKAKSGGGGGLLIGLAAVALLAVAGGAGWYFVLGPGAAQPTPAPTAPPVTLAQATPPPSLPTPEPVPTAEVPVEETTVPPPSPGVTPSPAVKPTPTATPTPGKPSPSPSARPTPKATTAPGPDPLALRAQQVATLVGQADQALGQKRYDAAVALYDQALQLEPGHAQATRGKSQAQAAASAAAAAARRTFVAGHSVLVGAKTDKKLSGFESEDVAMAKAPDYSGRIDFEASPKSPRAGEGYTVKVYLLNDGKKDFKIASLSANTNASGEKSGGPMAAATREVRPQQRALVQELTGVWKEGATSWTLEVSLQSSHGETVRNTLTWR